MTVVTTSVSALIQCKRWTVSHQNVVLSFLEQISPTEQFGAKLMVNKDKLNHLYRSV